MIVRNILIQEAQFEPITDQEAVDHLREDMSNIAKIRPYMIAARKAIEQKLISIKLTQATYEVQMDDWINDYFGSPIVITYYPNNYNFFTLPASPLVSVSSIKYTDQNNVEQTLSTSNYAVDTASSPGRWRFTGAATVPGVYDSPNAVRVRYIAGFGAAGATDGGQSAVPENLKAAVKFKLQQLWERGENAEALDPIIDEICASYRIPV